MADDLRSSGISGVCICVAVIVEEHKAQGGDYDKEHDRPDQHPTHNHNGERSLYLATDARRDSRG